MPEFKELARILDRRFEDYLQLLGGHAPAHRVEFSKRITTSWALIYYRRHLVRLSPYLFLLEPSQLKHESYWKELDATLRHEAAHATAFALNGETGHGEAFHALLAKLGVAANGACDLGPENVAFRYLYACPGCHFEVLRRQPLRGNWSCGDCAPGQFHPDFKLELRERLADPWTRVKQHRDRVIATIEEGSQRSILPVPNAPLAAGPVSHSSTSVGMLLR